MPKVNRLLLEAEFQNKGDIYDDTRTEGAFNVLASQIDKNDDDVIEKTNHLQTQLTFNANGLAGHKAGEVLDHPDQSVTTAKIRDLNVTTQKIANGNVTNAKLGADSVTRDKIKDGEVGTSKLEELSVTTSKIANDNVTTPKIADKSVTGPKIADSAITNVKYANYSITYDKIAAGALDVRYYTKSQTEDRIVNYNPVQERFIDGGTFYDTYNGNTTGIDGGAF